MAEGRRGARPANGTQQRRVPARTAAAPDVDMCPRVEAAFELLSRKWAGVLIHVLSVGPRHFGELRAAIPGVSARMLAARMKELEQAGLLRREVQTASPVRVLYTLTEKGRALIPVMAGIAGWARAWIRE
jgi:DNA-binding HxlR family transcriptional regulator